MCGPVAQWIRHLTTNQGIPGSNPGGVANGFFLFFSNKKWPSDERHQSPYDRWSLFSITRERNRKIQTTITKIRPT